MIDLKCVFEGDQNKRIMPIKDKLSDHQVFACKVSMLG